MMMFGIMKQRKKTQMELDEYDDDDAHGDADANTNEMEEILHMIVENNGIDSLLQAIEKYPNNVNLLQEALHAIGNVASSSWDED